MTVNNTWLPDDLHSINVYYNSQPRAVKNEILSGSPYWWNISEIVLFEALSYYGECLSVFKSTQGNRSNIKKFHQGLSSFRSFTWSKHNTLNTRCNVACFLTSTIGVAEIGETPNISQTDGKSDTGKQKICFLSPLFAFILYLDNCRIAATWVTVFFPVCLISLLDQLLFGRIHIPMRTLFHIHRI